MRCICAYGTALYYVKTINFSGPNAPIAEGVKHVKAKLSLDGIGPEPSFAALTGASSFWRYRAYYQTTGTLCVGPHFYDICTCSDVW